MLASLTLLKKLGRQIVKKRPKQDETFESCNNWDNNNVKVKKIKNDKWETPYNEHINACIAIPNEESFIESFTRIKQCQKNAQEIKFKSERITHISNFKATTEEINKAKKLTKDAKFEKVNLEHIRKIDMKLYQKCANYAMVNTKTYGQPTNFICNPYQIKNLG